MFSCFSAFWAYLQYFSSYISWNLIWSFYFFIFLPSVGGMTLTSNFRHFLTTLFSSSFFLVFHVEFGFGFIWWNPPNSRVSVNLFSGIQNVPSKGFDPAVPFDVLAYSPLWPIPTSIIKYYSWRIAYIKYNFHLIRYIHSKNNILN